MAGPLTRWLEQASPQRAHSVLCPRQQSFPMAWFLPQTPLAHSAYSSWGITDLSKKLCQAWCLLRHGRGHHTSWNGGLPPGRHDKEAHENHEGWIWASLWCWWDAGSAVTQLPVLLLWGVLSSQDGLGPRQAFGSSVAWLQKMLSTSGDLAAAMHAEDFGRLATLRLTWTYAKIPSNPSVV